MRGKVITGIADMAMESAKTCLAL
ncbi:MAG: hypothetical protein ACKOMW_05925 [Actinomycetes bacterium]